MPDGKTYRLTTYISYSYVNLIDKIKLIEISYLLVIKLRRRFLGNFSRKKRKRKKEKRGGRLEKKNNQREKKILCILFYFIVLVQYIVNCKYDTYIR